MLALGLLLATFYKDVLPIFQEHCQSCHRPGEIAPMPLETYAQARPYAAAIRELTTLRQMPPWFADPCCGHFSNDPALSNEQIATLAAWANAHAPAGSASGALPPRHWEAGWNIDRPDLVLQMPRAKQIPAAGDVPYQYVVIPTGFKEDRWVRMSEIRPSNRAVVHHAVAYIRPPSSQWLRGAKRGDTHWTDSDILLVYAPGSLPDRWPEGYAKLVPAGSDIVLQMHYSNMTHRATQDQTSVGLVFAKQPPAKRVLTLQLTNDRFSIPPGDPN